MSRALESSKCVAVFTPMIGGLYYSELITQIIQLCEIKSYRVKVFRTGGYAEYDMELGVDDVDIIILLRNAVHSQWVKAMRATGKAVVSVSYDYFPLDVPVVVSDHSTGVTLALDCLQASGASSYTFIGNLTNFDVRKRYESFCDHTEDRGLRVEQDHLLVVDEDLLSGGYQAARAFLQQKNQADGLIFGTTMNAIGFCRYIKKVQPELLSNLNICGFDANSMVPVLESQISTIDQNFNLVAYKAIGLGEKICSGIDVEQRHSVEPKIIQKESGTYDSADAYMATSYENSELSDPNYMKCLLYNMHEWSDSVAKSHLDEIMALRPVFEGLLEVVTFGRFVNVGATKKMFKVLKAFLPEEVVEYPPHDKGSLSLESHFPVDSGEVCYSQYKKEIHFVICKGGEYWGCLSTFGTLARPASRSSLIGLSMYIEWILTYLRPKTGSVDTSSGGRSAKESRKDAVKEGEILWNINQNSFKWDDNALSILGFDSDLDRGIYRNMELSDRVLESDLPQLRQGLSHIAEGGLSTTLHFRHKNREYISCDILASPVGEAIHATFILKKI